MFVERDRPLSVHSCLAFLLAVLLGGDAYGQNRPTVYSPPTFEPMSLEQYQAAHPELRGLDCGMEQFFDTYINVFGVTIAAMPNTPVPEIIHAAKIYAQLLDNDEDFRPDDRQVFEYHQRDPQGRNLLIVLVDTKALDDAWIAFEPGHPFWVPAQALRPGKSGVGHSRDGEFDVAVEELFHKYGKALQAVYPSLQSVYPQDFGLPDDEAGDTWSSTLSAAMDRARGIDRDAKRVDGQWVYPPGAWYTYDATSCGWGCQVDEYLWHIWATNIGYYQMLTRPAETPREDAIHQGWCENLRREWKPCTRQELQETDSAAYDLLNNKGYPLPTRIPYGEYGGNRVEYHGYEAEVRHGASTEEGLRLSINRVLNRKLTFHRGHTYYFDQSLKSNAGMPLRFSTFRDGIHGGGKEYRQGVTVNGVPGQRGSYVKLTVPDNAPDRLFLYCPLRPGIAGDTTITLVK